MNTLCTFFILSFCAIFGSCMPSRSESEAMINGTGVYVRGMRRSGKIMIGRSRNPQDDRNMVSIEFDSIQERSRDNASVVSRGRRMHRFNQFANQNFEISRPERVTVQSISAIRVNFSTTIESENAVLDVELYLFLEDGTFTIGNEDSQITRGSVKFNIQISNWTFCQSGENCTDDGNSEIGDFLDFSIRILSRGPPQRRRRPQPGNGRTRGEEFDLGGNATVILSKKVIYDGDSSEDMPGDFPILESRGANRYFRFRFRRFNSTVWYDPIIGTADADVAPSGCASLLSSVVMIFVAFFLQFLLN